jgi:hypothetical protein
VDSLRITVSFETPTTQRARPPYLYSPETNWPICFLRYCSLFISSYDSRGYGGGILSPSARGRLENVSAIAHHIALARTALKTCLYYCVFSCCRGSNVLRDLFPSNVSCVVARLHSCYLAVCLRVKISSFSGRCPVCLLGCKVEFEISARRRFSELLVNPAYPGKETRRRGPWSPRSPGPTAIRFAPMGTPEGHRHKQL